MNKFRVFVKDKFDVVFDTIEKARECRRALQQLKYEGIEIIVTQEDIDPRDWKLPTKQWEVREKKFHVHGSSTQPLTPNVKIQK